MYTDTDGNPEAVSLHFHTWTLVQFTKRYWEFKSNHWWDFLFLSFAVAASTETPQVPPPIDDNFDDEDLPPVPGDDDDDEDEEDDEDEGDEHSDDIKQEAEKRASEATEGESCLR